MSKARICLNCAYYEDRGLDAIPIGERSPDQSGAEIGGRSFAPRCLKGLNPSLGRAPQHQSLREQGAFEPDAMAVFCDSYIWAPPISTKFKARVRWEVEYDPRFSTVDIPEKFIRFWEKGPNVRIKVEHEGAYRFSACGYVAMSAGWKPVFVLCRSINSKCGWEVLRDWYNIVGIRDWNSKRYKVYRDV